jgi:ABC-type Fe3+-citrate transport system substrate-binding protein
MDLRTNVLVLLSVALVMTIAVAGCSDTTDRNAAKKNVIEKSKTVMVKEKPKTVMVNEASARRKRKS